MKKYNYYRFAKQGMILVLAAQLCGCGVGSAPEPRRKMPDFNTMTDGIEFSLPFTHQRLENLTQKKSLVPFAITNVDLILNGSLHSFVSVPLLSPGSDSLAYNMINTYKLFAMPLLAQWSRQERNGVLLDLRSKTGNQQFRADYLIEQSENSAFPVVFLWDNSSSQRAAVYMNLMQELPGVSAIRTDGQ